MGYHATGKLEHLGREEPWLAMERRILERVGREVHRLTIEHTPVAKPPLGVPPAEWIAARKYRLPSTLKDSWRLGEVTIIDGGRRMSIDVYTNDPIAPYVEFPTLPHIIVPRKPGGLLRFWDRLGRTVYATIVHHTGTKGSYMLTTAFVEVAALWERIGTEELERWAREAAVGVAA